MMVLCGTFYLFLLFVTRVRKISHDADIGSPRATTLLKCAAAGGHLFILGIMSVPGVLLLLLHGPAVAIIGAVAVAVVGVAAVLLPSRPFRRRAPNSPHSRAVFLMVAVLFWCYLIQLGIATTGRFFPKPIVRNGKVVCVTAWKGKGFRENMFPLIGLWYVISPKYNYTERIDPDGKTVTEQIYPPNGDRSP